MTKIKYNLLKNADTEEQDTSLLEIPWFYKIFMLFLMFFYLIYTNYLMDNPTMEVGIPKTTSWNELISANLNKTIMQAIEANRQRDDQKFFINTSKCHIPYIDAFTPALLRVYKPPEHDLSPNCTHDEAIVEVDFDEQHKYYRLHINFVVANLKMGNITLQQTKQELRCCYQDIIRTRNGKNVDSSFKYASNALHCAAKFVFFIYMFFTTSLCLGLFESCVK